MTKIVTARLPNAISAADVKDAAVRAKVMLLIENINALQARLANAEKAVVELQRR